jgi:hypothetical protein
VYFATLGMRPGTYFITATNLGVAGIGQEPTLPGVIKMVFRNKGRVHRDNCCSQCETQDPKTGTNVRIPLGVGVFGTGKNAIELQFKLSGHHPNVEYDIKRLKRKSTWERVGGTWNRLELLPTYVPDDSTDVDECLIPKNDSLFSMDAPGFPLLLPRSHGMTVAVSGGISSSVHATDIVMRWSFTEFVLARDKKQGLPYPPWVPISPCFFWHSVTWLTHNSANQWVLDKNRSRIQPGTLSTQVLNSPPGP